MREEILASAVHEFLERDEATFRVAAVAKRAGCATSVLYHYFGSKEGLIDAALIAIITDEVTELREWVRVSTEGAESASDAVELIVTFASWAHSPTRRTNRSIRARLVGACQTKPAVREAFCDYGRLVAATNESLIEILRDKGLVRTDLDTAALGLLMRCLDFGQILDEINESPHVDFNEWLRVVRALAESLAGVTSYLPRLSAD